MSTEDKGNGLRDVPAKATPRPEATSALRRVYEEIREVEHWLAGFGGQQAGVPCLRGLRAAVEVLAREKGATRG